jgi:hypothetical protein
VKHDTKQPEFLISFLFLQVGFRDYIPSGVVYPSHCLQRWMWGPRSSDGKKLRKERATTKIAFIFDFRFLHKVGIDVRNFSVFFATGEEKKLNKAHETLQNSLYFGFLFFRSEKHG